MAQEDVIGFDGAAMYRRFLADVALAVALYLYLAEIVPAALRKSKAIADRRLNDDHRLYDVDGILCSPTHCARRNIEGDLIANFQWRRLLEQMRSSGVGGVAVVASSNVREEEGKPPPPIFRDGIVEDDVPHIVIRRDVDDLPANVASKDHRLAAAEDAARSRRRRRWSATSSRHLRRRR